MQPSHVHPRHAPILRVVAVCAAFAMVSPAAVRAHDDAQAHADEEAPGPNVLPREMCPTDVPGTSIVATPTEDGAALVFVSPRHVLELRRRIRALASVQNRGALAPPEEAEPTRPGEPAVAHEPTASVQFIEQGAMLKFTPSEFDQLADVQSNALNYAQRLAGGHCPLVRDADTLLPTDTRQPDTQPGVPMPSGIVPGVGPIDGTGAILSPSLVI